MSDKYELITEIMKVFDERDRLVEVCNAQEKQLRSYKVMDGGGELDDFTVRIIELARSLAYDKVEDYWGKRVKIIEHDDGRWEAESFELWKSHFFDKDKVPQEFAVTEMRDFVMPVASKKYERYKCDAVEDYEEKLRAERESEDGDDE